ncbi:MAG: hypothetical protein LQ337_004361 [Flavoplaca oasis]|nr:MAG: hypothetical protein LQ337_004361 [Flavoplaca oasis]
MSNFRGLAAATELTGKDSRFAISAAWVACILGLTGIILFFAYSSRAERTITGKITLRASITTGQRNTKTGRVSNSSHQDGSTTNPENSHSAGAQSMVTTDIDTSDARGHPSLNQDPVQANTQVPTSNDPPNGSHNGSHNDAPGTSDKIPHSQHPTNKGVSHKNSSGIHASGTDVNTAPSHGLVVGPLFDGICYFFWVAIFAISCTPYHLSSSSMMFFKLSCLLNPKHAWQGTKRSANQVL